MRVAIFGGYSYIRQDLFTILGIVCVYEDHLAELAGSLLQLLIDFGIDINAERYYSKETLCAIQIFINTNLDRQALPRSTTKSGNALLAFKEWMELAYCYHQVDSGLPLIHLLYRTGIDVSVWSEFASDFLLEPSLFSRLPDLALG